MRSIILHSLIVFSSLTIYAQDKSFTVEVSSDTILIGNYIKFFKSKRTCKIS